MGLPSLASVAALEARLGVEPDSLADTDLARAEAALEDASILVRAEAGKSWVDGLGALSGVPDPVATVVVLAAARAYRNPDGLASESIGGAYAYSYGSEAQGGVYLTDAERRIVRVSASASRGVYTVGTPSAYGVRPRVPEGYEMPPEFLAGG